MELRELIAGAKEDNQEIYQSFFREYEPKVEKMALEVLRDPEEAAACAHLTMRSAFQLLGNGANPGVLEPWLLWLAREDALEIVRRRRGLLRQERMLSSGKFLEDLEDEEPVLEQFPPEEMLEDHAQNDGVEEKAARNLEGQAETAKEGNLQEPEVRPEEKSPEEQAMNCAEEESLQVQVLAESSAAQEETIHDGPEASAPVSQEETHAAGEAAETEPGAIKEETDTKSEISEEANEQPSISVAKVTPPAQGDREKVAPSVQDDGEKVTLPAQGDGGKVAPPAQGDGEKVTLPAQGDRDTEIEEKERKKTVQKKKPMRKFLMIVLRILLIAAILWSAAGILRYCVPSAASFVPDLGYEWIFSLFAPAGVFPAVICTGDSMMRIGSYLGVPWWG